MSRRWGEGGWQVEWCVPGSDVWRPYGQPAPLWTAWKRRRELRAAVRSLGRTVRLRPASR